MFTWGATWILTHGHLRSLENLSGPLNPSNLALQTEIRVTIREHADLSRPTQGALANNPSEVMLDPLCSPPIPCGVAFGAPDAHATDQGTDPPATSPTGLHKSAFKASNVQNVALISQLGRPRCPGVLVCRIYLLNLHVNYLCQGWIAHSEAVSRSFELRTQKTFSTKLHAATLHYR